jgi:glycosyltransferase involved in cell wall biosynthesis
LVHTFHTDPKKEIKGIKRKIFEFLLQRYDRVTFVSRALMETFKRDMEIDLESACVVYSGVSVEQPSQEEYMNFISTHGLEDRFPILCFLGPLTWKLKVEGVKRLIGAFEIVNKSYPSSALLIVGDGEYRGELEVLVKERKLKDCVIFKGFVDKPEIPLSIADIYTHISLQEGLPLALLEAMALGKPVVASRTGGIPEVIVNGENGLLVDSEPEIIAEKIIDLAANRDLMINLGENAQSTIMEKHDWGCVTEAFLKIYGKEIGN